MINLALYFVLVPVLEWFWFENIPSFSGQNLLGVFIIAAAIGLFFFVCGIMFILMSISKLTAQQGKQESADMG